MKAMAAMVAVVAAMLFAPSASHASVDGNVAVAANYQFVPPVIVIQHGQSLSFTNADASMHSLTSTDYDANGQALFDSGFVGIGKSGDVAGVSKLAPNSNGYSFACMMHSGMKGTLIVL